jgi:hypothetical protein
MEIVNSPEQTPLANRLGANLDSMLQGDYQVLGSLMQNDPEVFRDQPMAQLRDHAFNVVFQPEKSAV